MSIIPLIVIAADATMAVTAILWRLAARRRRRTRWVGWPGRTPKPWPCAMCHCGYDDDRQLARHYLGQHPERFES